MDELVVVADEVRAALADGIGVVALETTLVAHGFPAPDGVAVGLESERRVRAAGAVPATIGVLDGRVRVGLEPGELERFTPEARKCGARDLAVPRLSIEPGRAIVGPAMCTVYEVGTVKAVELDAGAVRTYISVDGGMSDNIRTALYDADYSATLASRASADPAMLARVVGKHCEAGDIVVKDEFLPGDLRAGDLIAVPGTGAYCRSMASNYNHALRPPVIVVAEGNSRVVVRRETVDDLLATDVGVGS